MLEKCQKYSLPLNAKGKPFPSEPFIMALLLEQHKMINWLENKIPIPNKDSLSVQKAKVPKWNQHYHYHWHAYQTDIANVLVMAPKIVIVTVI